VGRFEIALARLSRAAVLAVPLALALTGCGTVSDGLRSDLVGHVAVEPVAPSPAAPDTAAAPIAGLAEDPPVAPHAALVAEPTTAAAAPAPAAADTAASRDDPRELWEDEDRGEAPSGLSYIPDARAYALDAALDTADTLYALVQQDRNALDADEEFEPYDPWEPFNEKMFEVNRQLDRFVLKPVANVYRHVMPEPVQVMIANGFDNIQFVPRMVNSLLQGKWGGAGRELSRFLINSTAGIGGLFDPAGDYWGIDKSREDFGQTLGVWGSGPGPYLILPLMEPLTVRDGIGKFVDSFMDPLSYVLPFFWTRLGMKVGETVNERALNYELFQGFEESVLDLYSAVRHGFLQRRQRLVEE
jgi:phospholipid-binding lipoprotein MlaA